MTWRRRTGLPQLIAGSEVSKVLDLTSNSSAWNLGSIHLVDEGDVLDHREDPRGQGCPRP